MVAIRKDPPEPALFFPTGMRIGLPHQPAIHCLQQPEPQFVECANHNFLLHDDAEHVGNFGGEFHIVAEVTFRRFAVALPETGKVRSVYVFAS